MASFDALLEDAMGVAKQAQEEERENKLAPAKAHYLEAVAIMIKAIQQEQHPQRRALLEAETRRFMERAEALDGKLQDANDPLLQEARLIYLA